MEWFTRRITLWIAVLLAIVVIGMLVLAHFVSSIELGTAGEWIGGILVGAALLVAVHEVGAESGRRRGEIALARDSEARRVWLNSTYTFLTRGDGGESTSYEIHVENSGSAPIHGVFLHVEVERTPVEKREDGIRLELREIDPIGDMYAYNGGEANRPAERAEVEAPIGTLGPGRFTVASFRTDQRTMPLFVQLTWVDVWESSRNLIVNADYETVYDASDDPL